MKIEEYPFAEWLEGSIQAVAKLNPETIGIVARSGEKDMVFTGYFNASPEDKAIMAHHIYSDVILDTVRNNIDVIREALEEDDDCEPDDADLEMRFDPYLGSYTEDC